MSEINLTLPFPPSGNHAVRHTKSGQHYPTKEATGYRQAVKLKGLANRVRPIEDGEVSIVLSFYRGERNGRLVRGDLDGFEKVLLDALQGVVYRNDSQIADKHSFRRIDRANPRVEVRAWPKEPAPDGVVVSIEVPTEVK